jgi:hypothetical protein
VCVGCPCQVAHRVSVPVASGDACAAARIGVGSGLRSASSRSWPVSADARDGPTLVQPPDSARTDPGPAERTFRTSDPKVEGSTPDASEAPSSPGPAPGTLASVPRSPVSL